jgi:metal-responsive CopG/Arc/MetJ family transcriptional regulator
MILSKKRVAVRVEEDDVEEFDAIADEFEMSRSQLIRWLIDSTISRYEARQKEGSQTELVKASPSDLF